MNKTLTSRLIPSIVLALTPFIPGCSLDDEIDKGYDITDADKNPERIVRREKTWYEATVKNHAVFERKGPKSFACVYDSDNKQPVGKVFLLTRTDEKGKVLPKDAIESPTAKNAATTFENNPKLDFLERFQMEASAGGPLTEALYYSHSNKRTLFYKPGERVIVFAYGNRTIAHVLPAKQGE